MRVEDQDAQVRPRLDRLAQQQRDGGRLADAGGADDGEVARQRVVDGDAGVDGFVLRQRADGDGMAPGEIVDRLQVAGADAVRDGADMRIGGDAAVEDRRLAAARRSRTSPISSTLTSMAFWRLIAPGTVGFADRIDQADGARRAEIDRDHLADRPQAGDGAVDVVGIGGDRGARAVALHDIAQNALVVLCASRRSCDVGSPPGVSSRYIVPVPLCFAPAAVER